MLDVGCGPGSITLDLARAVGPEGSVLGLDFSPTAIELAREAAAESGLGHVRFEVADVYALRPEALGLRQGGYDVVHAHQILHHLADPLAAVRAMSALVGAGGILSLREVDFGVTTFAPESPGLDTWLATLRSLMLAEGEHPDAGRRLPHWAIAAGADPERLSVGGSSWFYATPERRAELGASWAQRVLESSYAEQAVRHGLLGEADLRELSHAWLEWARTPGASFLMQHVEVIARF